MAVSGPKFTSIADLMAADARGELTDSKFSDELWQRVSYAFFSPEEASLYGEPVLTYFASFVIEAEVGNGGFAQAAYNASNWFEPAVNAFRKLGLEAAANLISEANETMARENEAHGGKFDAKDIGDLFSQFSESELAKLDNRLDEVNFWEVFKRRLDHVRANREAFIAIDQVR